MVTPVVLVAAVVLTAAEVVYFTGPRNVTTIVKKCTVTNVDPTNGHLLTVTIDGVVIIDARSVESAPDARYHRNGEPGSSPGRHDQRDGRCRGIFEF